MKVTAKEFFAPAIELAEVNPSTERGKRAAACIVVGQLRAEGLQPELRELDGLPIVTATLGPRRGEPTVVFHLHLDVIPPIVFPRKPVVQADVVRFTGVADTLGHFPAIKWAVRWTMAAGGLRRARVILLFTTDEENPARDQFARWWGEHHGEVDFVVTIEPPEGIGINAKGSTLIDVNVRGSSAHIGRYWTGVDAGVLVALFTVEAWKRLPPMGAGLTFDEGTSFAAPSLAVAGASNVVPDAGKARIAVRRPSEVSEREVERAVGDIRSLVAAEYAWLTALRTPVDRDRLEAAVLEALQVAVQHNGRPVTVAREHPLVEALKRETGLPEVDRGGASVLGKTLYRPYPIGVEAGARGARGQHGKDERGSILGFWEFAGGLWRFWRWLDLTQH